jgi:hypothetical protein
MYQINVTALVSDTHVTCEILNSKLGVIQAANTNLQVNIKVKVSHNRPRLPKGFRVG